MDEPYPFSPEGIDSIVGAWIAANKKLQAENARLKSGIQDAIDALDTRSEETVDVIEMLSRLVAIDRGAGA
jgi:hypothetical protein